MIKQLERTINFITDELNELPTITDLFEYLLYFFTYDELRRYEVEIVCYHDELLFLSEAE